MTSFRWTPSRMEQLEHAVQRRKRVALSAYLAMTGEEMLFVLDELEHFQVLDN